MSEYNWVVQDYRRKKRKRNSEQNMRGSNPKKKNAKIRVTTWRIIRRGKTPLIRTCGKGRQGGTRSYLQIKKRTQGGECSGWEVREGSGMLEDGGEKN